MPTHFKPEPYGDWIIDVTVSIRGRTYEVQAEHIGGEDEPGVNKIVQSGSLTGETNDELWDCVKEHLANMKLTLDLRSLVG